MPYCKTSSKCRREGKCKFGEDAYTLKLQVHHYVHNTLKADTPFRMAQKTKPAMRNGITTRGDILLCGPSFFIYYNMMC